MKTRNQLIVGFFAVSLLSIEAVQACEAVKWPYARRQTGPQLSELLPKIQRESLIAYFYHELSAEPKDRKLGLKLGNYLLATEKNKNLAGFYETLSYSADLADAVKPKHLLPLKEICELEEKALKISDQK